MVLRWQLDQFDQRGNAGIQGRFRELFRFLRDNPLTTFNGSLVSDLLVEEAAIRAAQGIVPDHVADRFVRALERAGYQIQDGLIRPNLPELVDLPAAEDEIHILLGRYNLRPSQGHLDHAIDNHSRGQWAPANSQIRAFLESLLDEIAYVLAPNAPRGQNDGEARREALAHTEPPFLVTDLFEWGNQGKNLVNAVFKRLHPQGAHPGLSDGEDSTFRLHLVLLLGRLFLRRFDARRVGQQ